MTLGGFGGATSEFEFHHQQEKMSFQQCQDFLFLYLIWKPWPIPFASFQHKSSLVNLFYLGVAYIAQKTFVAKWREVHYHTKKTEL